MKMFVSVLLILIFLQAGMAFADEKVSISLTNVPVRSALETLFRGQGVNFAITESVNGNCDLQLNEVSFEDALKALVKICGLTYRISDSVYIVEKKTVSNSSQSVLINDNSSSAPVESVSEIKIERIPLVHASPLDILNVLNSNSYSQGMYQPLALMRGNDRYAGQITNNQPIYYQPPIMPTSTPPIAVPEQAPSPVVPASGSGT